MQVLSVIRWYRPDIRTPEEASYILIRQSGEEGDHLCFAGAYENGSFLCLSDILSEPVDVSTITGWAYMPYDRK